MKLLNFDIWSSGELSKIGHHFRKYSDLKIDVIKKYHNKYLHSSMKKNEKDSDDFDLEN